MVTVPWESAPANYVPAAAVIRRGRALSGFIGRKALAGGRPGPAGRRPGAPGGGRGGGGAGVRACAAGGDPRAAAARGAREGPRLNRGWSRDTGRLEVGRGTRNSRC